MRGIEAVLAAIVGIGMLAALLLLAGVSIRYTRSGSLQVDRNLSESLMARDKLRPASCAPDGSCRFSVKVSIPIIYHTPLGEQGDVGILTPKGDTWCMFIPETSGKLTWEGKK